MNTRPARILKPILPPPHSNSLTKPMRSTMEGKDATRRNPHALPQHNKCRAQPPAPTRAAFPPAAYLLLLLRLQHEDPIVAPPSAGLHLLGCLQHPPEGADFSTGAPASSLHICRHAAATKARGGGKRGCASLQRCNPTALVAYSPASSTLHFLLEHTHARTHACTQ